MVLRITVALLLAAAAVSIIGILGFIPVVGVIVLLMAIPIYLAMHSKPSQDEKEKTAAPEHKNKDQKAA
jgi:hypothetical protein